MRALRSQSALSTAEIAVAANPGRPMFRTTRDIASQRAFVARASVSADGVGKHAVDERPAAGSA